MTYEKEDWTAPDESAERADWTSFLCNSKVEEAEASILPSEICLALHSLLELLQTNVKTPILVFLKP